MTYAFMDDVIHLAESEGDAILELYGKGWVATAKHDGSPLTAADLAANKVIVSALPGILDVPIVSEESPIPELGDLF